MSETSRPQDTTADAAPPVLPRHRCGCAVAHTTGATRPGSPHRSDDRPPHTPRGARCTGRDGGSGTLPPVPGPPALLPLLPVLVALVTFALITWQIAAHGPLRALDERLGTAVASSAVPRSLAGFLADLGNASVAVPVMLAAGGWAVWRGSHTWRRALATSLRMAAVPALIVPLKLWIARPGPPAMGSGPHDGFFPSGHAATAAVAYGVVVLLVARGRRWAWLAYALLNVGVGIGLVRCGYHWPLDVLGAWCVAGVLLWFSPRSLPQRGRPHFTVSPGAPPLGPAPHSAR
ncbi:phosphatase PAP2 family protein [Streptomyces sp. AV19]|uniref:phosphatase PAP2 family protein n=1 Tax=Streptomyces sp. AV19 TaxID=2793068 RepID=UPI0018FE0FE4|nr:phosphatase PAP2 family protein [Streptomyces sp. AV19]MBH1934036.1 phosphatase PAP2 family protein [Streptomyces sp. AV19]MDG4535481.1 phosphatase PAP2 family protein [Streptomyces sp. AV19]